MNCQTCLRELKNETAACPFCGSVSHLFEHKTADHLQIAEDEKDIRRMRQQHMWLRILIWIAVISFILWIILRIFSGSPSPQIPSFGEPDFF